MSSLLPQSDARRASRWVWLAAGLLFALHHDFWWYSDDRVVLGFLPIGLAYHVGYSIAAAGLWAAAIRFAWPRHLEAWADEVAGTAPPTSSIIDPASTRAEGGNT